MDPHRAMRRTRTRSREHFIRVESCTFFVWRRSSGLQTSPTVSDPRSSSSRRPCPTHAEEVLIHLHSVLHHPRSYLGAAARRTQIPLLVQCVSSFSQGQHCSITLVRLALNMSSSDIMPKEAGLTGAHTYSLRQLVIRRRCYPA